MKVSKNSWHYRFVSFAHEEFEIEGASLCRYFWEVIFCIFHMFVAFGILVFVTLSLASVPFFLLFPPENPLYEYATFTIGCFGWLFITAALTWNYAAVVEKKLENKTPGLFKSWIEAKKEKICPLIEVVDDD